MKKTIMAAGIAAALLGTTGAVLGTSTTAFAAGGYAMNELTYNQLNRVGVTTEAATVYNSQGVATGQTLAKGTSWKVLGHVQDKGGMEYFQVGGNQYVAYTTMTLKAENILSNVQTAGGVVTLTNSAAVVDATGTAHQTLAKGSSWKVTQTAYSAVDKETFYQVGAGLYIGASNVTYTGASSDDNTTTITNQRSLAGGVATVRVISGAPLVNAQGKTIRTLGYNTAWKTTEMASGANGHTYYEVGPSQYVDANSVTVTGNVGTIFKDTETTSGVATVRYNDIWTVNANGTAVKAIYKGSAWKVGAVAHAYNGDTYYLIGSNQYVSADFVSFQ
ncbi:hypothetical protein IV38_GL001361 [Lactobacillus selangorensis]|uniref:S-layer protein C-terminal domain-containing protein n=1 Tax=Lactobacillus selangorensis TaxID=81857 RepID=A0A0R2FT60_9LACO|nr:SLAP domain-containing protein [Lactobacillus selangorensis]KRN28362.1 hypothetical protein IV38_GL001361 [Lactobacillus selangorensis]KRN31863.1 hypothetical protein IV40_GL001148 [Lactobacillus selangorensis]